MNHSFDEKVRDALMTGTESSKAQKEEVWGRIQERMYEKNGGEIHMKSGGRKRITRILAGGTVAAALLISFFATTEPGKAAIGKIRDMFAPEKKMVEHIEGTKEENRAVLQESKMGYILYFDEERYTMSSSKGKDRIEPKEKGENAPDVFMEISQVEDKSPKEVAAEMEKQLKSKYSDVRDMEKVKEPLDSIFIYAKSGYQWNDTVVKVYLVDNTRGGTFVIKQQFFFEASEGHGARFDNILKEFKIVPLEK